MDIDERTRWIFAAGGLLWRRRAGQVQLAVIHRPHYDDWTLPKGKLDGGEEFVEAALREVQEETGCQAELGPFAGTIRYPVNGGMKEVRYWHMDCNGSCRFFPTDEVDRLVWLAPEDALQQLDYPGERSLVQVAVLQLVQH